MTDPTLWRTVWSDLAQRLHGQGGDSRLEARWMCQEVGGLDGNEWASSLDDVVSPRALERLEHMLRRRLAGEPLQYVLGSWSFRHLDLMVDRRVLIPRPETEIVVETALELARSMGPTMTAVDLGTGSGAIALSLAAELPRQWPVQIWATDLSEDALNVARANLAGIPSWAGVKLRLAQGSWFDALAEELRGQVDLVVSNPPYIGEGEALDEQVRDWEPEMALVSGPTGLESIEHVLGEAPRWLSPQGAVVMEIGASQGSSAADAARRHRYRRHEIRSDLAGRDRVLLAWR